MSTLVPGEDTGAAVEGRVRFVGPIVGQESRAATARIVLPSIKIEPSAIIRR